MVYTFMHVSMFIFSDLSFLFYNLYHYTPSTLIFTKKGNNETREETKCLKGTTRT